MPQISATVPDKIVRAYWVNGGCIVPPPHELKIESLKAYASWSRARVFVETGTYKAETTIAMAPVFSRVYSIELEPNLAAAAQKFFAHSKHVKIIHGDSGHELPKLLSELNERCLFWLDGHSCGPGTGYSQDFGSTPIMTELKAVLNHAVRDHVILIDDARYFTGEWNYPTVQQVIEVVREMRPDLVLDVCLDSIRIHPAKMG